MKTFCYNSFVKNEFMTGTFLTEIQAKSLRQAKSIAKKQCEENGETLLEVYQKPF